MLKRVEARLEERLGAMMGRDDSNEVPIVLVMFQNPFTTGEKICSVAEAAIEIFFFAVVSIAGYVG